MQSHGLWASDLLGPGAHVQPTGTAVPDHTPGSPEPRVITPEAGSENAPTGIVANPTFILVALLGIAAVLVLDFSVRLEVDG